jgi:hypothetical protein
LNGPETIWFLIQDSSDGFNADPVVDIFSALLATENFPLNGAAQLLRDVGFTWPYCRLLGKVPKARRPVCFPLGPTAASAFPARSN